MTFADFVELMSRVVDAHGVAVVDISNGKIFVRREYRQRGAIDFADFLAIGDKNRKSAVKDYE